LSAGFLEQLQLEDDWSFVVKIHALVEAAVTHALVARTGLTTAEDFFANLELSGSRVGKLVLTKALDLLRSDERRFVHSLSELRNFFVHDVKNVGVDLKQYFGALSKDKRKHLAVAFCYVNLDKLDSEVTDDEAIARLNDEPKRAIWSTAVFIVAVLQLQAETARAERQGDEYRDQIASAWKPKNVLGRTWDE
jgi:hypothetical protein